jgi:hypothetical protein
LSIKDFICGAKNTVMNLNAQFTYSTICLKEDKKMAFGDCMETKLH